ncbi:MAG TPA: hypothetical protein VMG12_44835 [Polyangiaceae bacterium]|nr:hypothetical protein [Polyangiaceae bacterium]
MKLSGMNRFALAAVFPAALLFAACKNDAQPASTSATPSATPAAASPSASPSGAPANPHGTGALPPGAAPPNAHGTPPMAAQMAPHTLEKRADGRSVMGPFSLVVPSNWTEKPSTSSMRAAQFQLPAPAGDEAEVVVYYFGETGAGSVQANIDRWVSQFKQPDDKPSASVAKIEKETFAGQEASVVSVSGRYVAPAMPGGAPSDKPDQSLVAVIVPSPKGPYYFRLIGSKAAVAAQEATFREALGSLKVD